MQWLLAIVLVSILGEISTDEILDKLLLDFIKADQDDFRAKMRNGFPELNLPPVDPVKFDPKTLEIKQDSADVVLELPEITLTGLSQFDLELQIPSLKEIIVTLKLDELLATGKYNVSGKVLRVFPIFGSGTFKVISRDSYLQMVGEFSKENGVVVFSVRQFKFEFEVLELDFENFLGGSSVGKLVQKVLPTFAKKILEKVQPEIEKVGRPRFESLINTVVQRDEVQNLLRGFVN